MAKTRIGQLVIDTADILVSARNNEERWWAVTRVARRIGAEAVNAGAFRPSMQEVCWVRSTKDPLWLEEYDQAGFATVDPLVRGALNRHPPVLIDVARHEERSPASGRLRDWRETSLRHGYKFLISHAAYDGDYGTGITLSCRDDPICLFGPGTMRAFSAVSAMMVASLVEPENDVHEGWAYGAISQRLVDAERDVLAYLANGRPEPLIADAMSISPFEVWRLIRSACLKMRVQTKEQALALAILRGFVEP